MALCAAASGSDLPRQYPLRRAPKVSSYLSALMGSKHPAAPPPPPKHAAYVRRATPTPTPRPQPPPPPPQPPHLTAPQVASSQAPMPTAAPPSAAIPTNPLMAPAAAPIGSSKAPMPADAPPSAAPPENPLVAPPAVPTPTPPCADLSATGAVKERFDEKCEVGGGIDGKLGVGDGWAWRYTEDDITLSIRLINPSDGTASLSIEEMADRLADGLSIAICTSPFKLPKVGSTATTVSADHPSAGKFTMAKIPVMSIREFIRGILRCNLVSGETMIIAVFLITRLKKYHPKFPINILTVYYVLLASVVVATKFFDDRFYNNFQFAKVGNMPLARLNELEVEILYLLNFDLFVSTAEYQTTFAFFANRDYLKLPPTQKIIN